MTAEFIKNLGPDQVAILVAVLIYVTKELVSFVSQIILRKNDKIDENTEAVKDLNFNIRHLTTRLDQLEKQLEDFKQLQHVVWKLEKDVTFAHEKIRDFRNS